ncbi:MAG: hypothetical protein AAF682_02330 [Planctomycetota bacterium]
MTALPDFVQPMLARIGEPFDSDEHLFEVKWDGIRSLAFVESSGYRMRSRTENHQEGRYPELAFLERLPAGTLLDGELVVLKDGRPNFREVMRRERTATGPALQALMRDLPVTYVVFDVLYAAGTAVMELPLRERRELLRAIVGQADEPRLVLSDGVVGAGLAFFETIKERRVEGMVAKHLDATYLPGRRTDAWIKIKEQKTTLCLILGYVRDGADLKSLVIAADFGEGLRSVGRVGSGLTERLRAQIRELCASRRRDTPLIASAEDAVWIEPGLYCKVGFLELTEDGNLRAPVFHELIVDDHA